MDQSTQDELAGEVRRVGVDTRGELPRDYAIAWRAYLAGLLEWGVLDVASAWIRAASSSCGLWSIRRS